MGPRDAVLQDVSEMLRQVGALLERNRCFRLELEAERTPGLDGSTHPERAVCVRMLAVAEQGLIRGLEATPVDSRTGVGARRSRRRRG